MAPTPHQASREPCIIHRVFRFAATASLVLLASCQPYAVTVERYPQAPVAAHDSPPVIPVIEGDDEHHPYDTLADIEVHARQITVFGAIPTRNEIKRRMGYEAAALGADAVLLVRFGQPGMGPFSWNELEGRGRAIRYRP